MHRNVNNSDEHSIFKELISAVKKKHCHIVLSEGEDDRVIAAAVYVAQESRTTITLLGRSEIILSKLVTTITARPLRFSAQSDSYRL